LEEEESLDRRYKPFTIEKTTKKNGFWRGVLPYPLSGSVGSP
jgi:hypothetical protein